MYSAREKMNRALKSTAVPRLRTLGFKGTFPHFRRMHEKHVDLLVFQFNKYGGSFVVELAQLDAAQVADHWKPDLTLEKATAYDSNVRRRLGSTENADHWFAFGQPNDDASNPSLAPDHCYEAIASKVVDLLATEGEQWWRVSSNPTFQRTASRPLN